MGTELSGRFLPFVVIVLSCLQGHAQDWQTHYQSALEHYQQGQFGEAMSQAEKAMSAAPELKGQTYARQIFTAACLATEVYDKGLTQIVAEIEGFRTLEPASDNYTEAIRKKGQLLVGTGRFAEAAKTFHELSMVYAGRSGRQSYEHLVALAEEAGALMQAKKLVEAQQVYEASIAGFRVLPDAGEDFLYALFNSAYIDHSLSNKTRAITKLSELIAFLEQNQLQSYPEYSQARQMLSSLNVAGGNASAGFMLPEDQARQLFEKAFSLQETNFRDALRDYNACEEIIATHQLRNNTTFSCHLNYGRLLFAGGDYTASRVMLEKARHDAAALYDPNGPESGHVDILTADLALQSRDVGAASQLYQQGIRKLKAEKTGVWVKQIRWVGEQLIAAKAGEQAIPVIAMLLGDACFATLEIRDKIIIHQLNASAYLESRQADKLLQFVWSHAEGEKSADLRQTFLLLAGQAALRRGALNEAHEHFLKGIVAAPSGIVIGELYFESARTYQQLGDYKEAEIHYRHALEHIVRAPSSETTTPLLFNSLAAFYIQLGNYGAAERFFVNLLAHDDGSAGFYNAVRQNLAALYQQTGHYAEARSLLLKTLQADALRGTDHPDYAIALQNLAAVYQDLGRLDSALVLYEQALAIDRKYYGEESLSYATKLANLGTVYQEGNKFDAARTMFEKALAIRGNLVPSDHPDYAYSQYVLANLLYRTQKPREALPLFKACAESYLQQINNVFPALSDYERTAFYNRVYEVIATYQMFLLENITLEKGLAGALLNFRLQTKALLLNSSLKVRNQILHSGDNALITDFNVWKHTKDQLAYLYSLTKEERQEHAGLIEEYSQQANAREKSLSLKSEQFSAAFVPGSQDWRQIQAVLKPGEGAMEIVRVKLKGSDSVLYAALIVKPGLEEPSIVINSEGNLLEQKVFNGYINRIRYQLEDPTSYNVFWKKFEPFLTGVRTLYFSPDGVYTKVNCLALYDPEKGTYLIDRMKMMLVSNLQDIAKEEPARAVAPHALLVGYPDYRLDATKRIGDLQSTTEKNTSMFTRIFHNGFAELPGTEKEVNQIQHVLASKNWRVEKHLREAASEEKIKASRHVTLLHIATHGFFVAPTDEHAVQVYSSDLRDIDNNSMLRSGLLLAGAEKNLIEMLSGQPKSQVYDGILTAYEVMNLTLDDADLVVLSACETGMGDVRNGEGVYGLQRAFLLAGAKHVMMSLWKVDDVATQELMATFYKAWLSGDQQLDAFHGAQLRMKAERGHPYYWGAFVMMGGTSP